jgi:hypothetical protein
MKIKDYLIVSLVTLTTISACKKDRLTNDLKGSWFMEMPFAVNQNQYIYQTEYRFKDHGKIELYDRLLDRTSKAVLGFKSKSDGDYRINNDILYLENIKGFHSKDYNYVTLEEVNIPFGPWDSDYKMSIEPDKKKLTLIPICGPSEDCVPYLEFYREY